MTKAELLSFLGSVARAHEAAEKRWRELLLAAEERARIAEAKLNGPLATREAPERMTRNN